jgi:hypothetical protein
MDREVKLQLGVGVICNSAEQIDRYLALLKADDGEISLSSGRLLAIEHRLVQNHIPKRGHGVIPEPGRHIVPVTAIALLTAFSDSQCGMDNLQIQLARFGSWRYHAGGFLL